MLAVARPLLSASPDYLRRRGTPSAPMDLVDHNCIAFTRAGRPFNTWRFALDGHWTTVRVTGDRLVDDASLAREWAVAGAGIILMTELEQKQHLLSGALVPLLTEWKTEPYPLYALFPNGRFLPKRIRAFVDFIAERFSARLSA